MSDDGRVLRTTPVLRSLLSAGLLYFALFVAVHALLAFTTDGATPVDAVCLALVALPELLLVLRRSLDLGTPQTAVACAALVLAACLGLWTMRTGGTAETYSAWFLGAIAFDLLALAILGRFRAAWITMAAVLVVSVVWALTHGMPAIAGLGLVIRHVATLLVGTALAVSLRRSTSAFTAFQALRLRRVAEEEAGRARAASRRSAVEQVLEQAGPTLQAIAAGQRFTEEDRQQMLVLEGALRDQIRTPLLVHGALRDSVAAARRRGVNVLLMDEVESTDPALRAAATEWLAEQLDGIAGGGFVGRLRLADDALRVSAVGGDQGAARSFPLPLTVRGS